MFGNLSMPSTTNGGETFPSPVGFIAVSSGSTNREGASSRRSQNFAKNRSNDADNHRRLREERTNQLRKERRAEQTANQRKKFKFDTKQGGVGNELPSNSSTATGLSSNNLSHNNFARLYDVNVWQQKTEQLSNPSKELRLGAMEYLRRILTVERNPPIELLLNSCTNILPSMIRLLRDHSAPEIQFESAWAITNLACGEAQYVQALLELQMIDHLMEVIATSKQIMVKDQCLWALFNISTEEMACRVLIQREDFLMAILALLGIHVQPPSVAGTQQSVKKKLASSDPSLSIIRHVAFICCNIIKSKELQVEYLLKGIFQAFAELLQSPDEEIISDILATLAITSAYDVAQIQFILEAGIISRLCELVDTASHLENSMHVLASSVLTPDPLQSKTILYEFHHRHLKASDSPTEQEFLDNINISLFDYLVQFLNQRVEQHRQQQLQPQQQIGNPTQTNETSGYSSSFFPTAAPITTPSSSSSIGNKMFKVLPGGKTLPPVRDPKAYVQPTIDMLQAVDHILSLKAKHFLLRRREHENVDSMRILMLAVINCCRYFMLSIHPNRLNVVAGACFCSLLENYGNFVVEGDLFGSLESMINLVQIPDDRVIYRALLLWQGYLSSPHPSTPPAALQVLKPKLGILKFYSIPEIVQLAKTIDEQVTRIFMST